MGVPPRRRRRKRPEMLEPRGNAVPDSVTVCVTSCGRPDLLARTLESFRHFNPGGNILISEDCADPAVIAEITAAYPDMTVLSGPERLGHMLSIDRLFS